MIRPTYNCARGLGLKSGLGLESDLSWKPPDLDLTWTRPLEDLDLLGLSFCQTCPPLWCSKKVLKSPWKSVPQMPRCFTSIELNWEKVQWLLMKKRSLIERRKHPVRKDLWKRSFVLGWRQKSHQRLREDDEYFREEGDPLAFDVIDDKMSLEQNEPSLVVDHWNVGIDRFDSFHRLGQRSLSSIDEELASHSCRPIVQSLLKKRDVNWSNLEQG